MKVLRCVECRVLCQSLGYKIGQEMEPELPGGGEGLPEIGTTRAWDLVICDEAHRLHTDLRPVLLA